MKNILNVKNLTMSYGVEPLYEDVSFGIDAGEKVAVVGPNGCGKSTLFKLLAGRMTSDEGEIIRRGETTLGYLAQSREFAAGKTPRDIVADALESVRRAIEQHDEISNRLGDADADDASIEELLDEQSRLQERIQKMGGWSWEHRVEEMLDRLGISAWIDEPIGRLSGGQRRRVDLARVLLKAPDLLLLDEPTNHLDTTAAEWLEAWLIEHGDAVMFVTHDRYFLENVADRILEIDDDGFFDYPGNYRTFIERKRHRTEIRKRTEKRRQKEIKKELEWLGGGVKARNTRSKKRIKQLEELQDQGPAYRETNIEMRLAEASRFGDVILNARGLYKSFDDNVLFEAAHFDIRPDDTIGIIGPNGSGKSTLLDILAGNERYDAGTVERGKQTDIAHLHQNDPAVDPDETVYDAFSDSDYVWIGDTRYHKQAYLKRFLFDRGLQKSTIGSLSGGQKRRFALARTFAKDPNLLFLDEPTNDLDIMSLEELESTLEEFDGCIVTVSHDRYFLNRVCDTIVAVEDNKLVRYEGNYDDYRKKRDELRAAKLDDDPAPKQSTAPKKNKSDDKPKQRTGLSYRERQHLDELEDGIEATEARIGQIESTLSDPALYDEEPERIEPLNRELQDLQQLLEDLMEEWTELEARRE